MGKGVVVVGEGGGFEGSGGPEAFAEEGFEDGEIYGYYPDYCFADAPVNYQFSTKTAKEIISDSQQKDVGRGRRQERKDHTTGLYSVRRHWISMLRPHE